MTDRIGQRVVPRPLVGVGDLLTGTRRAWFIPEEVPVGLSILLGNEGSGKSTLAVDYAFRIARDFPVVMMGADGQAFYAALVEAWTIYYRQGAAQLHFDFGPMSLLDDEQRLGFINTVSLLMPRLIIIDPVGAYLPAGPLKIETIDALLNACEDLQRQTGASLLLVAHTDGLDRTVRDHLVQRCDVTLALDSEEPPRSVLSPIKTIVPKPFMPRNVNIVEIELDEERVGYVASRSKKLSRPANLNGKDIRILRELDEAEAGGGLKANEVVERTGIGIDSVYRAANRLKTAHLAYQESHGGVLNITPQGKTLLARMDNTPD